MTARDALRHRFEAAVVNDVLDAIDATLTEWELSASDTNLIIARLPEAVRRRRPSLAIPTTALARMSED